MPSENSFFDFAGPPESSTPWTLLLSFSHHRDPVGVFAYIYFKDNLLSHEVADHQTFHVRAYQVKIIFFAVDRHTISCAARLDKIDGHKRQGAVNADEWVILPTNVNQVCAGINLYKIHARSNRKPSQNPEGDGVNHCEKRR